MQNTNTRSLGVRDLDAINDVITDAVLAWSLPERVKRLSLPLLRYDEVDLEHFAAIGAYALDRKVRPVGLFGVAVWDRETLHGLYVRPEAQRRGVGRHLLRSVAAHARQAGVSRLLVKAERVSADYFRQQGLMAAGPKAIYPHSFYLETAAPMLAEACASGPAARLAIAGGA
ncbi:MAG: GNAT family N-acetyltransferase [Gammaproteobacteria bacterium]|jgi:GNAT superfamily N-acetyltransferase|nr:MAG: GNAT family N-acetyltransferase [Gammaproteobacteria bacterium]